MDAHDINIFDAFGSSLGVEDVGIGDLASAAGGGEDLAVLAIAVIAAIAGLLLL